MIATGAERSLEAARKKILFVDDDPDVLEGLERMLHGMRREWEMTFVGSGGEALSRMEAERFDVVVCDMRMPGVDGLQVLSEAQRRHPGMVRIVLSAQSDREQILRSVGPSHQFLSKPCAADVLKVAVTRACALRDLLAEEGLKDLVAGIGALPSFPPFYREMMEELRRADASVQKVGRIVAQDMGMAAKILQMVNSAYFGLPRRISNAQQAVTLLGLDTVKSLAFGAHVFSKFEGARVGTLSMDWIWHHSLGTAVFAKAIAHAEGAAPESVDDAFTAGLLHDVGRLVLGVNVGDRYERVYRNARDHRMSLWDAEREEFQTTHAEVGAYLLGLWGLPDAVVEAVAHHHHPERCPGSEFGPLAAVHVADALEYEVSASQVRFDYLERLGLEERIWGWRSLCHGLREEGRRRKEPS